MMKDPQAGMPDSQTTDKSISAYFEAGNLLDFTDRETIVNEFDQPRGVFLIRAGFVKAFSISDDGQLNLFFVHQAGEIIPLPWALDGAHITGLTYEAISYATLSRVSKDSLRAAMGQNPWLSQEVLKQAVDTIAVYTQRIQTLEFRSARGRIISEVLSLAQRFGEKDGENITINVPLTHQDLADSINMNRETASRALGQLIRENLITQTDHHIVIVSLPRLQEALS